VFGSILNPAAHCILLRFAPAHCCIYSSLVDGIPAAHGTRVNCDASTSLARAAQHCYVADLVVFASVLGLLYAREQRAGLQLRCCTRGVVCCKAHWGLPPGRQQEDDEANMHSTVRVTI
jgi:hypothetical protein